MRKSISASARICTHIHKIKNLKIIQPDRICSMGSLGNKTGLVKGF